MRVGVIAALSVASPISSKGDTDNAPAVAETVIIDEQEEIVIEPPPYAVTVFGGPVTTNSYPDVFTPWALRGSGAGVAGVSASRVVATAFDRIQFEIEGQALKHFGSQTHFEFAAPLIARWVGLQNHHDIDVTFALGLGLSYATATPKVEIDRSGESHRLRAYWLAELEVGLPGTQSFSLISRLHHRSTAFGVFGDDGSSNAIVFGIRNRF